MALLKGAFPLCCGPSRPLLLFALSIPLCDAVASATEKTNAMTIDLMVICNVSRAVRVQGSCANVVAAQSRTEAGRTGRARKGVF